MPRLFEQFVERIASARLESSQWRLESQVTESGAIVNGSTGEPCRSVRPDLVVSSRGGEDVRCPVDAKYKPLEGRPPMEDLRQAALYGQIFGRDLESSGPHAALVYPSEDRIDERLAVRRPDGTSGVEIAVLGLPVAEVLEAASSRRDDGRPLGWRGLADELEVPP